VGPMWRYAYCPDAGVREELDGVPWPRRPRDSDSALQGRQSSHEAHAAWRRLHVASGAAPDSASAHSRAHAVGHAAVRTGLVGTRRQRPAHAGQ
jgi:hypothetical protein